METEKFINLARVGLAAAELLALSCDNRPGVVIPGAAEEIGEPGHKIEQPVKTEAIDFFNALIRFYPELIRTRLQPKDTSLVLLNPRVETAIVNFTGYQLNHRATPAPYHVFEFYAGLKGLLSPRAYNLAGQDVLFNVSPWEEVKTRYTVITPSGTPHPSWQLKSYVGGTLKDYSAATLRSPDGFAFSYAEAINAEPGERLFMTPQAQATLGFAIEVCQQTLRAEIVDAQRKILIRDKEQTEIAQEVVCNSLGYAVAARLLGASYDNYMESIKRTGIGPSYIPFAVSKKTFDSYPVTGPVIE